MQSYTCVAYVRMQPVQAMQTSMPAQIAAYLLGEVL